MSYASLPLAAPVGSEEQWMAFWSICADESCKIDNPNCAVTSLCGFLANAPEWDKFGAKWFECQRDWNVPAIHMAWIMHPDEHAEWDEVRKRWERSKPGTWESERDRMLMQFARLTEEHKLYCTGAVVDAEYFRLMPKNGYKAGYKDPLFLAFEVLVLDSIALVRSHPQSISIVLDDDEEQAMNCYYCLKFLQKQKEIPEVKERICGICFGDDSKYPQLQAADMIAYDARNVLRERKANLDYDPPDRYKVLTKYPIYEPKFYEKRWLEKLHGPSI